MNLFNIGRGNLFGILIPGVFLLGNILLLLPNTMSEFRNLETFAPILNKDSVLFPLLFILSYIIGFSLRLIKPTILEKFSILLWWPYCIIKPLIELRRKRIKDKLRNLIVLHFWRYWESFPYIDWFIESYLNQVPRSYKNFYLNTILRDEFDNKRELMRGHNFINLCKLHIYNKSSPLRDEIFFNEGIVRFLAGMCYALFASIILIIYLSRLSLRPLLIIYLAFLILFIFKLRHIRTKEVVTIFDSYFFTRTLNNESKSND